MIIIVKIILFYHNKFYWLFNIFRKINLNALNSIFNYYCGIKIKILSSLQINNHFIFTEITTYDEFIKFYYILKYNNNLLLIFQTFFLYFNFCIYIKQIYYALYKTLVNYNLQTDKIYHTEKLLQKDFKKYCEF
ncbi:hypothetical protein EDEG_00072 [Edhazardia aedis USNM 41457]|uniref:Transmembrane protein n=1 Tax=Edhazardia aedis (strain USNM 41457) TaxID=1003232 RepID=J9DQV8_EDHAE|nr:hypothetical protein EDEG_00072 [Edhazardia aedis USNM 41457]|eukprot:EJW04955.1 hypothetical protein EDEG_00072 [Edhazardia aedis USNM 41457]